MNSQSDATSGSPYSAIHDAPADSRVYRRMSSSGTPQITAPNSSGYVVSMLPTSSPPLLRPSQPRRAGTVTPRATRSRATAAKSS